MTWNDPETCALDDTRTTHTLRRLCSWNETHLFALRFFHEPRLDRHRLCARRVTERRPTHPLVREPSASHSRTRRTWEARLHRCRRRRHQPARSAEAEPLRARPETLSSDTAPSLSSIVWEKKVAHPTTQQRSEDVRGGLDVPARVSACQIPLLAPRSNVLQGCWGVMVSDALDCVPSSCIALRPEAREQLFIFSTCGLSIVDTKGRVITRAFGTSVLCSAFSQQNNGLDCSTLGAALLDHSLFTARIFDHPLFFALWSL